MQKQWREYLLDIGAYFDNNRVSHFGRHKAERKQALEGDIITDLSHFGVIKVSGKDAENFLQGQFTNDVRNVTDKQSQLSAWCSHKGRILVNFHLFQRKGAYYILLPQSSLTAILKRLKMYVLRSAVTLEDVSASLFRFGIIGSKACFDDTVLEIPGNQSRYIVLTENPQDLWQCVTKTARPVGADAWELLDILDGLPQIFGATSEKFVPQMVNFQAIGAISFKKGCYTGQEIIARMQYLGSLKRRMYLAKIETNTLPQAGDEVYVNDESVGKIVNAQIHPDGGCVVLAVIIISQESENILWQDKKSLQLMDLPYSLS
ncbi:MAG: folate-binding protein YgfZ [Thiotrichaceae bacterium]|nr:folate-binding protein YgfZ [Thiotrichaceae bacterium]